MAVEPRIRTVDGMKSTLAVAAIAALVVAGCSSDDGTASPSAPPATSVASSTTAPTTTSTTAAPTTTEAATPVATSTVAPTTGAEPVDPLVTADELDVWLDSSAAADPTLPGELATLLAPGTDASAAGGAYDLGGEPLDADASFRIASVTKTFTAAAILRLVETGELGLDDTLVSAGTPAAIVDLLRADGYVVDEITVAQLLNHSSGLFDYAFGVGSPYVETVFADPTHVWTRDEQVAFATEHGDPLGVPGAVTAYSDTGYVVLGSIIEARTGLDLGDAYAELLHFDELGLGHTYLETPGSEPRSRPVVQRFGDVDVRSIDASVDLFGGGGLVSTSHDLAVFFRSLWAGGVFDDPTTWTTMTAVVGPDEYTAQGLFRTRLGDHDCWFHEGFWGVEVITCPDIDLTLARSWNQASPSATWRHEAVVDQIVDRLDAT